MSAVIVSLLTFGSIDMIDPYGITTLLMLLQLVRKDWHVLIKLWTSYVTYWLTAIAVYFGLAEYAFRYFDHLPRTYPTLFSILALVLAVVCLAGAIALGYRVVKNWASLDRDISQVLFIKSVHPVFLVFFGMYTVLSNLPVLWPMFSFIAVLIPARLPFPTVVVLLGIFTMFSRIPQLFVYYLYRRLEADRFARIMSRVKSWLSRFMVIAIPIVLFGISIWAFRHGFRLFEDTIEGFFAGFFDPF